MPQHTPDLLSDAEWANHAVNGLERDYGHGLTLDEWANYLSKQNADVFRERPASTYPTGFRPGTPGKIEVMAMRVKFQLDPFSPDDVDPDHIPDEEDVLPIHAPGNFATIGGVAVLNSDRNPPEHETLAERCRRWVREDLEIRRRKPCHCRSKKKEP